MEIIKALCPTCSGQRNCAVHGALRITWDDPVHPLYGSFQHHLLQCNGCETVFYQQIEHFSEHTTHEYIGGEYVEIPIDIITTFPPTQTFSVPPWVNKLEPVDAQLYLIFTEMYSTYVSNHFILSAIGLRTIFDRTTELLQIHPGLSLNEKVEKLKIEGFIGDTESVILKQVIDAGNAAAHRSWSPKKAEFEQLLEVIENFVLRTVLGNRSLDHITKNLPERVKRPPKK